MTISLARTITFTIPDRFGPGVQVTAVENATGGIDFIADVLGTSDLRGLFFGFNEAKLNGLAIGGGGGLITNKAIKANGVLDLGQGAEMHGVASPFDVGIRWGTPGPKNDDITFPVTFTLSNPNTILTLDDIAHQEFGARVDVLRGQFGTPKITTIAPAAPDARADVETIFEDGVSGVGTPSILATGVLFDDILKNDSDGDGDKLTITYVEGAQHGTVQIVDGDDADTLIGDAVLYTPNTDYSGTDSFVYLISDGAGGQDSASVSVNVLPVADTPLVTIDVLTPEGDDPVNMIRLKVTATQTDDDGSEYIDRIAFDALPAGYTLVTDPDLNTSGLPGDNTSVEYVQLYVPTGQDVNYDLRVTAYAQEEATLGAHEASSVATQNILVDFNHNEQQNTFQAVNQSIWGSGDAFTVDESFFIGVNQPIDFEIVTGHFQAGFQANLTITGGDIDASLPMDVTIDTTYNETTDSLLIETSALLAAGGSFSATGLGGSFDLGFLLNSVIDVAGFDPLTVDETVELFPDLLPFDSTSSPLTSQGPGWGSFSIAWPNLSVTQESADLGNGTLTGDGASNDFLSLTADIDALALSLLGGNAIARGLLTLIGPDTQDEDPESTFQYVDVDITASANLLQQFVLDILNVEGTLTFEDNSTQSFTLGDDIVIRNAGTLDLDGDGIEFDVSLNPNVTLDNNLAIGFDVRGDLWLLKNEFTGLLETYIPLFNEPLGDIPIGDGTPFDLAFQSQTWNDLVV